MEYLSIKKIKNNPNNPRTITDDNFEKLVKSIKEFPKMLELRPIVTNDDFIVLGGNMRLKACLEAGLKKVPHIIFSEADATEANKKTGQKKTYQQWCDEFVIKDNVGFGDWDWALLNGEDWNKADLKDWGLPIWDDTDDIDYSVLDDDELSEKADEMAGGVKRAIQIEFEAEHYAEATELIKFFREQDAYIGALLIEKLRAEKAIIEKK